MDAAVPFCVPSSIQSHSNDHMMVTLCVCVCQRAALLPKLRKSLPLVVAIATSDSLHLANDRAVLKSEKMCVHMLKCEACVCVCFACDCERVCPAYQNRGSCKNQKREKNRMIRYGFSQSAAESTAVTQTHTICFSIPVGPSLCFSFS